MNYKTRETTFVKTGNRGKLKAGFYRAWLITGLIQFLFGLGLSSSAYSSDLFSQSPTEDSSPAMPVPVRIPRSLFSKNLQGTLTAQSENPKIHIERQSLVLWTEEPTQLPPPSQEQASHVLADYRDYKGCLQYQDLDGVAVCFNVMPDVSSVGANEQEMQLQGVDRFVSKTISRELANTSNDGACLISLSSVRLVKAERVGEKVNLQLQGVASPQGNCALEAQPMQVQLELYSNTGSSTRSGT